MLTKSSSKTHATCKDIFMDNNIPDIPQWPHYILSRQTSIWNKWGVVVHDNTSTAYVNILPKIYFSPSCKKIVKKFPIFFTFNSGKLFKNAHIGEKIVKISISMGTNCQNMHFFGYKHRGLLQKSSEPQILCKNVQ